MVLEFPPSESLSRCVSLLFLYGTGTRVMPPLVRGALSEARRLLLLL